MTGVQTCALPISGRKTIGGSKGQIFSLFSFDMTKGVYIKNGKYPLVDATLKNTFPIGVSNELLDKDCEIEIKDGYALLIVNKR